MVKSGKMDSIIIRDCFPASPFYISLVREAPVNVFMVVADGCISSHSTHITNYISMKYFYFLLYLYYSNGIFARHTHINNLEIGNTVFCRLLSTMG